MISFTSLSLLVSLALPAKSLRLKMTPNVQKLQTLSTAFHHSFKSRWLLHHCRLLHHGPDTMEELLDRHVVKKEKSLDDDENELLNRQRLTSSRREALSLYRDVIRATRFFMWANSQGIVWRDVLRENVRKEFEEARYERDPEVITRLLIGGRDALQAALDKLAEKQKQEIEKQRGNSNTP